MRYFIVLFICFLSGLLVAGEIVVMQEARYAGDFGLKISVNSVPAFLEDGSPSGMSRYRARLYCMADDLDLAPESSIVLFRGYDLDGNVQMELSLINDGEVKVNVGLRTNSGWQTLPAAQMVTNTPGYHVLELDFQAGSGIGYLRLTVDDEIQRSIEGINNSGSTVEYVRLGMVDQTGTAPDGHLYFDDFVSTSGDPIGPITCGTIWQYQWGFTHFGNGSDVRDLIQVYNNPCFVLR